MKKPNVLLSIILTLVCLTTFVSCNRSDDHEEPSQPEPFPQTSLIGNWKLESIVNPANANIETPCELAYNGMNIRNSTELNNEKSQTTQHNECLTLNHDSNYTYGNNILHIKSKDGNLEIKYKIVKLDSKLVGKLIYMKEISNNGSTVIEIDVSENWGNTYTFSKK